MAFFSVGQSEVMRLRAEINRIRSEIDKAKENQKDQKICDFNSILLERKAAKIQAQLNVLMHKNTNDDIA